MAQDDSLFVLGGKVGKFIASSRNGKRYVKSIAS